MDIGRGRLIIFPFDGGLTPSRSMIFMMRLQNGIHARVVDRAVVFQWSRIYGHRYQSGLL